MSQPLSPASLKRNLLEGDPFRGRADLLAMMRGAHRGGGRGLGWPRPSNTKRLSMSPHPDSHHRRQSITVSSVRHSASNYIRSNRITHRRCHICRNRYGHRSYPFSFCASHRIKAASIAMRISFMSSSIASYRHILPPTL